MILVTCAIIEKEGMILAAQRSATMSHPLKWEFPGGKIEEGESEEDCLHREILEELNLEIEIVQRLTPVEQHYAEKSIRLIPFRCRLRGGNLILHEHLAVEWELPERIHRLDFSGADVKVLEVYREYLERGQD